MEAGGAKLKTKQWHQPWGRLLEKAPGTKNRVAGRVSLRSTRKLSTEISSERAHRL